MKFRLVVEHDERANRWSAYFPELPGCASAGDTENEAVQNAREALDLWLSRWLLTNSDKQLIFVI